MPRSSFKPQTRSLYRWREFAGMTRAEAADFLGVQISYYHKLEGGKIWPTLDRVMLIVSKTDGTVSPNDLYETAMAARLA